MRVKKEMCMQVQINSDNNISMHGKLSDSIGAYINNLLQRFDPYLTRVEVHLTGENVNRKNRSERQTLRARSPRQTPSIPRRHQQIHGHRGCFLRCRRQNAQTTRNHLRPPRRQAPPQTKNGRTHRQPAFRLARRVTKSFEPKLFISIPPTTSTAGMVESAMSAYLTKALDKLEGFFSCSLWSNGIHTEKSEPKQPAMNTLHTILAGGDPYRENRTPPITVTGAPSVRIGVSSGLYRLVQQVLHPAVDLPSPPKDMLRKQIYLRISGQLELVRLIIKLLPTGPQVHTQHPQPLICETASEA